MHPGGNALSIIIVLALVLVLQLIVLVGVVKEDLCIIIILFAMNIINGIALIIYRFMVGPVSILILVGASISIILYYVYMDMVIKKRQNRRQSTSLIRTCEESFAQEDV